MDFFFRSLLRVGKLLYPIERRYGHTMVAAKDFDSDGGGCMNAWFVYTSGVAGRHCNHCRRVSEQIRTAIRMLSLTHTQFGRSNCILGTGRPSALFLVHTKSHQTFSFRIKVKIKTFSPKRTKAFYPSGKFTHFLLCTSPHFIYFPRLVSSRVLSYYFTRTHTRLRGATFDFLCHNFSFALQSIEEYAWFLYF